MPSMPSFAAHALTLVSLLSLLLTSGSIPAADWKTLTVPDAWRSVPGGDLAPINGYSWYRILVKVPPAWTDSR